MRCLGKNAKEYDLIRFENEPWTGQGWVCTRRGGLELPKMFWKECQDGDLIRFESALDWSGRGLQLEGGKGEGERGKGGGAGNMGQGKGDREKKEGKWGQGKVGRGKGGGGK